MTLWAIASVCESHAWITPVTQHKYQSHRGARTEENSWGTTGLIFTYMTLWDHTHACRHAWVGEGREEMFLLKLATCSKIEMRRTSTRKWTKSYHQYVALFVKWLMEVFISTFTMPPRPQTCQPNCWEGKAPRTAVLLTPMTQRLYCTWVYAKQFIFHCPVYFLCSTEI